MKQKGKLTISRVHGSSIKNDYIQIELRNAKTYKVEFRIDVNLKEFSECLTGLGFINCSYEKSGGKK